MDIMCSIDKLGYVNQNINRKLVRLYLIVGVLKLKSAKIDCSKYAFVRSLLIII